MKKFESKKITRVIASGYSILVPVYYENEDLPAWRKVYTGTYKECEELFLTIQIIITQPTKKTAKTDKTKYKNIFFCVV